MLCQVSASFIPFQVKTLSRWKSLPNVFFTVCGCFQTLLELGASPNYKDSCGLTPLYHTAVVGGDPFCCELLLHEHATVSCKDENGWQEIHQVGKICFLLDLHEEMCHDCSWVKHYFEVPAHSRRKFLPFSVCSFYFFLFIHLASCCGDLEVENCSSGVS